MEINNFVIPPFRNEVELPSVQEATEQAFYAAATKTDNPIGSFMDAKNDLLVNGKSNIVDEANEDWKREQEETIKSTIQDIITDPTVDQNVKFNVINKYRLGDFLPSDLKERYIQKTAANDSVNDTEIQRKQQDWVVANMQRRRDQMAFERRNYDLQTNNTKLQSFLAGMGHLYKGAGNTLGLVSDEEYKIAHEEYEEAKGDNPISTGVGNVAGLIGGAMVAAPLGIAGIAAVGGGLAGTSRFAELGQTQADMDSRIKAALVDGGLTSVDFALPIFKAAGLLKTMVMNGAGAVTLGEMSTAAQNYILDAYPELKGEQFNPENMTVNAILGGLIGAVFGRRGASIPKEFESKVPTKAENSTDPVDTPADIEVAEKKVKPHFKMKVDHVRQATRTIEPGSPAKVTEMANPKVAEDLGNAALDEPSGALAEALGTNKASIVHDWVMPKMDETEFSVDLSRQLKAKDESMREVFEDMRYNPSVVNATQRDADSSLIYEAIRETRAAAYQPANSLMNFADNVVEGKMVFGPNETGLFTDRVNAQHAYDGIKETVDSLPPELRGNLQIVEHSPERFSVEWRYRKEYDDSMMGTFGPDSVKTSVLGVDLSGIGRSMASRGFFPVGRFSGTLEQGAIRAPERQARLERNFITSIQNAITSTPHKKQLSHLILRAEEEGKEAFSKAEIGAIFPDLTTKQISNLFDAHTLWRRANHYVYAFANRELKNDLISKDMVGAYKEDGTYLGPVSNKWTQDEIKDVRKVWDFNKETIVGYNPQAHPQDATLVRLGNHVQENGSVVEYALIGPKESVDILPNEVLPRIPGYSPRKVDARYFVDVIPTRLEINGRQVTDPKVLRKYTRTVAASKNEAEGNLIIENIRSNYPDATLHVRPDRQDTFGKVIDGMEIHGQILQQAQRRGERLPGLDGPAPLEDRLVTMVNMSKALAAKGAFREWENAFKDSFVKSFPRFIKQGEFPRTKKDIIPLPNMSREENKMFETALRSWEYFQNQRNFETWGDHLWKQNLHNAADVLEKFKVPHQLVEGARLVGDKDNLLVRIPKQLATFAYIHSQPLRQWLIQPAQLWEFAMISPTTFKQAAFELPTARLWLASEHFMQGKFHDLYKNILRNRIEAEGYDVKEWEKMMSALSKSGIVEGIDMNVLVHGIFKDIDRQLVEGVGEKAFHTASSFATAIPRAARQVGFDAAELTNRVGMWLQTLRSFQRDNPGVDWSTKENLETISSNAMIRSGTMNRAGNLPYQEGMASVFFQFAAIQHKLLLNILQDNVGGLTKSDRAKLAAARISLYGLQAGIPGSLGYLIYALVDKSDDPELVENANLVRTGLQDYFANTLVAAIVDPDVPSDLAVGEGMSPHSEHFLPYFDVAVELMKMADNNPSNNPRFAGIQVAGSILTAVNEMKGWFVGREVNTENIKQAMLEAAEVTSGWSNYSKGLLMLGTGEKVTSMGNTLGLQHSKAEAYAKMLFGVNSKKEALVYESLAQLGDFEQGIQQLAKDIHKSMSAVSNKIGEQEWQDKASQINAFMSLLPSSYTDQHKIQIIEEVMKLDRRSQVSVQESLLGKIIARHRDGQGQNNIEVQNKLSRSVDPKTQEMVKLWREGKL